MARQEKARVNINILGISELKWKGTVDLIYMTILYTTEVKNPLKETVALILNIKKVGLKLNIQKTKFMASGPITSW